MGFKIKQPEQPKKEVTRIIPIDKNNEQLLLGQAINFPKYLERLVIECDDETFLYLNHKALFRVLQVIYNGKLTATIDKIESIKFKVKDGQTIQFEYTNQLIKLFRDEVNDETFTFHLKKLKEDKVRDEVSSNMLPIIKNKLVDPKIPTENIVEEIDKLRCYIEDNVISGDFKFVDSRVVDIEHNKAIKEREEIGVFGKTGFTALDNVLTDGYSTKKITIVAGRPGMCKSSFVGNSLFRLASDGVPIALYNFEMDMVSMYDRMISIKSNIGVKKIVKGRKLLTDEEKQREMEAKEFLRALPLYFYTASTQNMLGLRRDLKILKERYGVKIVAYDLFKKMRLTGRRSSSTADILSENLDEIQAIGKDLDIHQILVVQINRQVENRKDKRPRMSDLKDSGAFEEVADNILLMYRSEYYKKSDDEIEFKESDFHELEVIIGKQRQGGANIKVLFDFYPATTSIVEQDGLV